APSLCTLGRTWLLRAGNQQGSECPGLYDCNSAAERNGLAAYGARPPAHNDGRNDATQAHVGLSHAVAAGNGSCRYLDAINGDAPTEERRLKPPRSWAREVRRTSLEMERRIWRTNSQ